MKFKVESTKEELYCLLYKTYYKRHWWSRWRRFGSKPGYTTTEQCIKAIEQFKSDTIKIQEINNEYIRK